jgi:hypothetical protein
VRKRENHGQILISTRKVFKVAVSVTTAHALVKFFVGQVLKQLRKHRAASVHPALLPPGAPSPSAVFLAFAISNRFRRQSRLSRCKSTAYTNLTKLPPDRSGLVHLRIHRRGRRGVSAAAFSVRGSAKTLLDVSHKTVLIVRISVLDGDWGKNKMGRLKVNSS